MYELKHTVYDLYPHAESGHRIPKSKLTQSLHVVGQTTDKSVGESTPRKKKRPRITVYIHITVYIADLH